MEAPGDHKGFLVASDTRAASCFVAVKKNGVSICKYKGFKTASLCSHSFAVADHVAKLHEYLSWCHSRGGPNITAAASTSTPKNAGKKPGQKSFIWRTGVIASSRNDDSYTDRRLYVETASVKNEQRYHLKWPDKMMAKVCYGCRGKLRPSDSSVPPPPFDMVV